MIDILVSPLRPITSFVDNLSFIHQSKQNQFRNREENGDVTSTSDHRPFFAGKNLHSKIDSPGSSSPPSLSLSFCYLF